MPNSATDSSDNYCKKRLMELAPHLWPLCLLLALTVITWHELLTHSFLDNWDDPGYVTNNPAILALDLPHVKLAVTGYFVGNYAPVQIISYMLDHALWGLRPTGFLLTNIVCHFACGVLLYALFVRMGFRYWGAAIGCAVFLVHPVQVESVAWVSQRKNLLAMLFVLAGFHAYLNHKNRTGKDNISWYVASIFLCCLALLAKSVAVVFPFMLILYSLLIPAIPERLKQQTDKIPYLLAAASIGILTVAIQTPGAVGGRVEYPHNALLTLPLTMSQVFVRYLCTLGWPSPSALNIVYTIPLVKSLDLYTCFALSVIASAAAIGWYLRRRSRQLFFWYCLFFLGLLPVSQIVPLVTRMNDRYLYFPMLGIAGMIGYLYGEHLTSARTAAAKKCAVACAVTIITLLSLASYQRGLVWKNSITLFSDAVKKDPNQFLLLIGLAEAYRTVGNTGEAIRYYEKASIHGFLSEVESYHMAQAYLRQGDHEKAYKHIWGFMLKNRDSKEGFLMLGEYYGMTGNYAEAEKQLLTYLQAVPDAPDGLFILGKIYYMQGDINRAGQYFNKALSTGDNSPNLHFAMACTAALEGNVKLSLVHIRQALDNGFTDIDLLEHHADLATVRKSPMFSRLIMQHRTDQANR